MCFLVGMVSMSFCSVSKYYNTAELGEVKASLTNIEGTVTFYASKALLSFGIAF